jgi:hypothetical protein
VGNEGGDGNLERLVKPVKVKDENEVGNNVGDKENPPVREKNKVPGKKPGKDFQESMD